MKLSKVYLKPKKEESLLRFHPWVFSGAIQTIDGQPEEGDLVEVYGANNQFLAIGHYQIGSIAVRVLSFQQREIDQAFWAERIRQAYTLRQALGLTAHPERHNTFRLIHGEGDNLPGLVVDLYAHTAVMQAHSVGMHYARHQIAEALKEVLGDRLQNIYYKSETTLPYKANLGSEDGYLMGGDDEETALENGLRFYVDWQKGQKTGFFVDQRENRSLLERYAKGRDVLNMFCYTGGFSFYAMRGGAKTVHSVDSSAKAIMLTNKNVELNSPPRGLRRRRVQVSRADGTQLRPDHPRPARIRQAQERLAQRPARLSQAQCHRVREDQAGRYPVHLLLLAGRQQGKLPPSRLQRRRPIGP